MKIIQISDLHLTNTTDVNICKLKIDKMLISLKDRLVDGELLVICSCGDIFEAGSIDGYDNAVAIYDHIKIVFSSYNLKFEFIPGNHDIINDSFTDYTKLIQNYITDDLYDYDKSDIVLRKYDGLDILLINSAYHKNHKFGSVNLVELERAIEECTNDIVMLTHHTLMSRYADDESSIRNAYEFVNIISRHNAIALLHGHTHGYSDVAVGTTCKVIGVGPTFKTITDVSNQFNYINIIANDVDSVDNYSYRSDPPCYIKSSVYKKNYKNYYQGEDLCKLYRRVVENTKAYGCINNFVMHFDQNINKFKNDIESMFTDTIEIARQWQLKECPNTLYYNHGMLMDKGEIDGLEYIAKELNSKATSSRAILPLGSIEDVKKSGNGFFPSLDIIQFGFEDDAKTKLYITIYLRALEVNHFLKINLCEVYLMSKAIKDKIRSINSICVNINSFRAQYRENFGCFRKANIDLMDEFDMTMLVANKNIATIKSLLQNKLELSETVIKSNGIDRLCEYINKYNRKEPDAYDDSIVQSITYLQSLYNELKMLTSTTSIYSDVKHKEDEITHQIRLLIDQFDTMGGGV